MKMWIGRNEDECLLLHSEKPSKGYDDLTRKWYWGSMGNSMELDDQIYPEVTFENSPMEVELVIKNKMEEDLGMVMKKQKFEVELVYPAKYGEVTDARLLHIIEKGMVGREWGIAVTELKLIKK